MENLLTEAIAAQLRETAANLCTMSEDAALHAAMAAVATACIAALRQGNKILFAGNGGSAADAQHLAGELVSCAQCRQQVSPHAISGGRCRACRSLQPVTPDDPRLARILGEYPKLDHWPRWQLAETASVYVLTARSLLRRLLLVLDKESLEALRVAEGFRLTRHWPEIPPSQWDEFLG